MNSRVDPVPSGTECRLSACAPRARALRNTACILALATGIACAGGPEGAQDSSGEKMAAKEPAETARASGSLNVRTTPEGATVLVDGVDVGCTPVADLQVAPGSHALRIELAGHVAWEGEVTVAASQSQDLGEIALEPVSLAGKPSGVTAEGWGGAVRDVLHVEGAVPGAPLRLQDKPRPQNDWYVNRRPTSPTTMNFYATSQGETTTITSYVLGRLLAVDPDAPPAVVPALATSWEVSDDGLSYTFRLRRGVQFADGRPFTSADVLFSFDVMRDPSVNADHLRNEFVDVESVEAADPHTVVVRYRKRYWKGLYTVGYTLRILNKAWYEEQIPLWAERLRIFPWSTHPGEAGFGAIFNSIRVPCPGTGPYYLERDGDFTPDHIDLAQNPFYYGIQVHPDRYNLSRLRWLFIRDPIHAFEAFRKQEFDVTVVEHDHWEDQLRVDPTIQSIARYFKYDHTGLHCSKIVWNCRRPPFDDPRVRVAMAHLTDRQWILDQVERGNGTIAVCNSKRSYDTYSNDLQARPFDVSRAIELLAEAGWKDTDGDGVLDRDGNRFEFALATPSGYPFYLRVGGMLQDACKNAGVLMTLRPLEWSTFIDGLYKGLFDATCLYNSWSDPWVDNFETYHSSQDVEAGGNISGWHNAETDRLLAAMREEFDPEKRREMFHRFNRLFYDEQPETLLVHGLVGVLQNKRFENARIRPTGLQIFDLWVKPENVVHR